MYQSSAKCWINECEIIFCVIDRWVRCCPHSILWSSKYSNSSQREAIWTNSELNIRICRTISVSVSKKKIQFTVFAHEIRYIVCVARVPSQTRHTHTQRIQFELWKFIWRIGIFTPSNSNSMNMQNDNKKYPKKIRNTLHVYFHRSTKQ